MGRARKRRSPAAPRPAMETLRDPLPGSGGGAEGWGLAAYALALGTLATWGVTK